MGWDGFYAKDREQAIKLALKGWKLIEDPAIFMVGGAGSERAEIWTLSDSARDGQPYICCHLLDGPERAHSQTALYQHKVMGLEMGPFYYSCPVGWLERAPIRGRGEAETKWRAERLRRAGACAACGRVFFHNEDCPMFEETASCQFCGDQDHHVEDCPAVHVDPMNDELEG